MKKIIAMLLALVMVLSLAACGQAPAADPTKPAAEPTTPAADTAADTTTEPAAEKIALKVWGPSEDQTPQAGHDVSFLEAACEAFDEAHPEWEIEFVFEVCSEGDAGTMVTKDPAAAADVYMFANDQLGTLLSANAIARLGGAALEQVKADNTDRMISTVTSGDGVYGVPFTINTWFMYYNKSLYTEEDIKSLDAMMEKHPIAYQVTNTWYMPALYYAVGGSMFGDGTDGSKGIDFGSDKCAAVTLYMAEALKSGKMIDDASGAGLDGLRSGKVGAIFSGTWDADNVKSALGENYGAAAVPAITIDGEQYQMLPFAGSKAIGVNPNSKNMPAATALAAWLGSADMQALHAEIRNGEVQPIAKSLVEGTENADPAALAQMDTFNNKSVYQPTIAEMGAYWTNAGSMGQALANGEINAENVKDMQAKWNAGINNSGL